MVYPSRDSAGKFLFSTVLVSGNFTNDEAPLLNGDGDDAIMIYNKIIILNANGLCLVH
jgi:hypothetical protein